AAMDFHLKSPLRCGSCFDQRQAGYTPHTFMARAYGACLPANFTESSRKLPAQAAGCCLVFLSGNSARIGSCDRPDRELELVQFQIKRLQSAGSADVPSALSAKRERINRFEEIVQRMGL